MTTTYFSARSKLESAVRELQKSRGQKVDYEVVPIEEAVGRVSACDHFSPISTPEFDTSAMDGYAIRSESTKVASQKSPVFFCVKGTVAAGDDSPSLPMEQECDGPEPCFEIMTGGRFPEGEVGEVFDACVKVEDTVRIATKEPGLRRCIAISKPIPRYANRRFAGEDIQKGDLVLRNGMTIRSSNIMPLASVGIDMIRVRKKPRVCIWSTGNELTSQKSHVRDVNGVYLTAASKEAGTEADFFGSITDEVESLVQEIRDRLESSPMDLMITSGGVSVGKFDHVRQALELLGATIVFHGVAIRPGHPVLFALLPSAWGEVAFFGLPGNPGAAAACFKFLTIPYMKYLLGQELERPVLARLENLELGSSSRKSIMDAPNRGLSCDRFRPGVLHVTGDKGPTVYEGAGVLGPAKMAPFGKWYHAIQ
ncbi:MoeA, N-terminal and linker domain-containing protein [Fusarium redolens]|uniref:molybdopterin adenylyltransferase n=1 Tax=Fusarium redolens TaxID=48865 RepID=A0A9P9HZ75_FUSRE|nr:MoeA, N-terminal and linker domain-containing protein [Fusarium redolens]KAH7265567.1 MoeA, N-terminal and linker domain-containing protein [Fusarium redolens]